MRHLDLLGRVGRGKSVCISTQLQDSRSDNRAPLPFGGSAAVETADLPPVALEELGTEEEES